MPEHPTMLHAPATDAARPPAAQASAWPLALAALIGLSLAALAGLLWAHYGTAVFYETILAGLAACF